MPWQLNTSGCMWMQWMHASGLKQRVACRRPIYTVPDNGGSLAAIQVPDLTLPPGGRGLVHS